jgi:tetratricopeptide (TPR) repeat protein
VRRTDLPLSTTSEAASASFNEALERFLLQQAGVADLAVEAVRHDPRLALGWALKGLADRNEGRWEEATQALDRAFQLSETTALSVREDSVISVIGALAQADFAETLNRCEQHLRMWPTDAVIASFVVVLLNVFLGLPDRDDRMLAIIEPTVDAYGDDPMILGFLAFALEENRQFERAHDMAEAALAGLPHFTRAAHTLAHTYLETGRPDAGQRFLSGWLAAWEHPSGSGCHLEWHRGLFQFDSADLAGARRQLDTILGFRGASSSVLTDGASLAWRLHLSGWSDLPWSDLADLGDTPGFAFGTAHRAMVLAGLRDAGALDSLAANLAGSDVPATRSPALRVAATWAQALADYVRGDLASAAERLDTLAPQVRLLGGSHAQSAVFEDTHIAALTGSGRHSDAAALLLRRLRQRPCTRDDAALAAL